MNQAASTWCAGLGARSASASAPARDVELADEPGRRVVAATEAKNPFEQHRQAAGSAAASDDTAGAADATTQENPMARGKKARKATPKRGASPQARICALLTKGSPMTGDELYAQIGGDKTAFHSGTYLAKQAGRIEKLADGRFAITKAGKEWLATQLPDPGSDKPARAAKVRRGRTRKATRTKHAREAATARETAEETEEHSFRCAVLSDGSFFLAKDDVSIELDVDESRRMFAYLDRMAEAAA